MLHKRPLVSQYCLGCPQRQFKTFPILPWMNCISDIAVWLDSHGDPVTSLPRMALGINGVKGETVCFFSHSHKYALLIEPSDAYMRQ